MFNLIQLFKIIKDKDKFISMFSDLETVAKELECKPYQLLMDDLEQHFDITLLDCNQAERISDAMVKRGNLDFLKIL